MSASTHPTPFTWPDDMLDDRVAIVGTAGSGKTYAAKGLVERLVELAARICVVDPLGVWFGLRAGADGDAAGGLPITIFGGLHADIPITEQDGEALGRIVAGADIRCIVDVSELPSGAARRRFMLGLTGSLYEANRAPLHLVLDEADSFAPQNPNEDAGPALLGRVEQIVRRGRHRGFVPWLITQRPAVLNKNVLSQADILIAMKLTASQDRNAIGAWIEGQADREVGKRILAELPRMQRGTGYVWAPSHGVLEPTTFPRIRTFDSSRTPKRGETVGTAALMPVDAAAIAATLMRERKPDKKAAGANATNGATTVDLDAIRTEAYQRGLADGTRAADALRDQIREMQGGAKSALEVLDEFLDRLLGDDPRSIDLRQPLEPVSIEQDVSAALVSSAKASRASVSPAEFSHSRRGSADPSPGQKRGAEMRILRVLAERHPARLTVAQWATLAGMKRTGGTWGTYVSRLRTAGYLAEQRGLVGVTPAGLAAAGVRGERPRPAAEIRAMWKRAVGGAGRMIDVLHRNTRPIPRNQLAFALGMTASGGTFGTYLSRLRSNGLIVEEHGAIRLVEELR